MKYLGSQLRDEIDRLPTLKEGPSSPMRVVNPVFFDCDLDHKCWGQVVSGITDPVEDRLRSTFWSLRNAIYRRLLPS